MRNVPGVPTVTTTDALAVRPFMSEATHRTRYSPAAVHAFVTPAAFAVLKDLSPKSHAYASASPSGSAAVAVKVTVAFAPTLVALAASEITGV